MSDDIPSWLRPAEPAEPVDAAPDPEFAAEPVEAGPEEVPEDEAPEAETPDELEEDTLEDTEVDPGEHPEDDPEPEEEVEPEAPKEEPVPEQETYTVLEGEKLSVIASKLNVPGGWPALYEANREALGASPKVHAGQVLVLP